MKWLASLILMAGCQASTEDAPTVLAEDAAVPDFGADATPSVPDEPAPITSSNSSTANCAELLTPDSCEWANASENVLYWRITSVDVVKDDVGTTTSDTTTNESQWVSLDFDECAYHGVALEIRAEVIWSRLPIPSTDVSIIIGPPVLNALPIGPYYDMAKGELAWVGGEPFFGPDMVMGSGVNVHPTKDNTFVMNGVGLFREEADRVGFAMPYESCIEYPASLQETDFAGFTKEIGKCEVDLNAPFKAKTTSPAFYSTRCSRG